MHGIFFQSILIAGEIFCQFKPGNFILIFLLERRNKQFLVLGQKPAGFFAVAGGGSGLDAVISVHIGGNAFVEGRIFHGKVIIVFVIRIKIFQFPGKKLNTQLYQAAAG